MIKNVFSQHIDVSENSIFIVELIPECGFLRIQKTVSLEQTRNVNMDMSSRLDSEISSEASGDIYFHVKMVLIAKEIEIKQDV